MDTLTHTPIAPNVSSPDQLRSALPDRLTLTGYALLATSALLFGLEKYLDLDGGDDLTIFSLHYILAVAFVIVLIFNRAYGIRKSWRREHIHKTVILLNLFLVSAYALNRELPVFDESVTWFCVYLLLTSVVVMSYQYFDRFPKAVNYIQHLLLGSAISLLLPNHLRSQALHRRNHRNYHAWYWNAHLRSGIASTFLFSSANNRARKKTGKSGLGRMGRCDHLGFCRGVHFNMECTG
jgi:hypothetical protein